ncbi:MAG: AzlC family ABC transporter permease [Clostridia bacterium]|nr:AzlC family ABC transporter permease [Clostridia bacterium]
MKAKEFFNGVKDSIPVAVGYFSVSFGFGVAAAGIGLTFLQAALMSFTNVTSAGQFAALSVIVAIAPLINMFLTQLVINSRYALMSLALGQRLGSKFGIASRLIIAFYNTDEIFAIAMQREKPLTKSYMFGLGPMPVLSWTLGTFLGAVAGSLLPPSISSALGVALYGMFVAIVVPNAKKDKTMLVATAISAILSIIFFFAPYLKNLTGGISVVIVTVVSAAVCAALFPEED